MQILIHGGHVIDPQHIDDVCDIFIDNGKIAAIFKTGKVPNLPAGAGEQTTRIINAAGKLVTPGLVDMHVHLREPGFEHKETIASGCRAAVAGGFTAVCAKPNTSPVNDSPEVTTFMIAKAREAGLARVYPAGAITQGLSGQILCDYKEMKAAGAVAFTDDGCPVENDAVMEAALEAVGKLDLAIISHSEMMNLAANGAMNQGPVAARLGWEGIPNAAESVMVEREIALSEKTGARMHIAHVSTAESVRAIRAAKQRGVRVTAETAPHYFTLTDAAVETYGSRAKMNPPLRSEKDRSAILEGLADGTLDAIATDHAPHASEEKAAPFPQAPNGITGLETALPLSLRLVEQNVIDLETLVAMMATQPAAIIGAESGLTVGNAADITIIDPEKEYVATPDSFHSKSANSPFVGWELKGRAEMTVVNGRIVHELT
jgi:dihydroorotase